MEQYVSKSALVAEIERRVEAIANAPTENNRELAAIQGAQQYELINLIQFINTFEVKEMDMKKELSYEDYIRFFDEHPNFPDDWGLEEAWVFAKHFFELGIAVSNKAQKGEEV